MLCDVLTQAAVELIIAQKKEGNMMWKMQRLIQSSSWTQWESLLILVKFWIESIEHKFSSLKNPVAIRTIKANFILALLFSVMIKNEILFAFIHMGPDFDLCCCSFCLDA